VAFRPGCGLEQVHAGRRREKKRGEENKTSWGVVFLFISLDFMNPLQ
jgi:hypothetical protein